MSIPTTSPVRDLQDRLEISDLTARLGLLVDVQDWAGLKEIFTPEIDIDYSSLNGGDPVRAPAADIIKGWRQVLTKLEATQHLIAGGVVDLNGDTATATANVQATHVLANATGGSHWTVAGRYDYGLTRTAAGWRISGLKLTVLWASGNQQIMSVAT